MIMNKKYNKWLFGGLLGFLAIFSISSCSDDHFDVGTMTEAKGTLWDNIIATQKCDSFALILQKTLVNKKDYGIPATLTYEELLKSNRVLTVWAPSDGTYNAQKWLDLLEAGDNEKVEQQFVANHIAYFNYNGSFPEVQQVLMANQKYAEYDNTVTPNTFQKLEISNDFKNVPATNGTFHLLKGGSSPFLPNLREILAEYPELSNMYQYIESRDTVYFNENASTIGTAIDGVVHYVDSVFNEYNLVYPTIAEDEDSCCAAILPSNNAWNQAIAEIQPHYKYKDRYYYLTASSTSVLSTDSIPVDSLTDVRTITAILNNAFYSLDEQPGFNVKDASVETVGDFFRTCDSLMSKTYYKNSYKYHQHATGDLVSCRDLAEGKDPIKASNGYVFITDNFNFKSPNSWKFDIEIEGEHSYYIQENPQFSSNYSSHDVLTVTPTTQNPYALGVISDSRYMDFIPQRSTSKIVASYNLPNVLSGKYDIYVVMVPENMLDSLNTSPKRSAFTATINSNFTPSPRDVTKMSIGASQTTATLFSDPTKVDTILLFEDYEFPICYYGISGAAPILQFNSQFKTAWQRTTTPHLYIDKIILKSKDE